MTSILIFPHELTHEWIERAAKNNIDIVAMHPPGGKKAPETLEKLLELCETSEFRALVDEVYARGMKVEYEFHAAGYLVPRELFDTHPEYFRMDENGNRINDWNFCMSNEEALNLAVKRARDVVKRLYRSTNRYYFWLDDCRDKICNCPKCRSMTTADQQMLFNRRLLEEIRKDDPNATIAYLAYFDTMRLPTKEFDTEGMFLEYAPIAKSMGKDADPVYVAEERDMLKKLCDYFGTENARVLEYWLDNSLFSRGKKEPLPFAFTEESTKAMKKDIENYRSLGFKEFATFACSLGPGYEKLHGEPDISPFGDCFR